MIQLTHTRFLRFRCYKKYKIQVIFTDQGAKFLFKFKHRKVGQDESIHSNRGCVPTKILKPVLEYWIHITHQQNRQMNCTSKIFQLVKKLMYRHSVCEGNAT